MMVWVFITSRRISETATFVFIASSVWGRTISGGYTVYEGGTTHVEDVKNPVEV